MESVEQIRLCQNLLVNQELANWTQSQRLFNWEDDRGKLELNTMQQWCVCVVCGVCVCVCGCVCVWRWLGVEVCSVCVCVCVCV